MVLTVILMILGILVFYNLMLAILFRKEIRSVKDRDPAATNTLEIVLSNSGLHAIIFYRIGHALLKVHCPLLPRLLSQFAKWYTGIEIHPGATIGDGLFIDHGTGVVIGETTIIGNNVTLFQGVTLGGTGKEHGKRHPNILDDVVVGAGAKILGNITISENSYVGANAVILKDVPPNSTVVGVPGRLTRQEGKRIDATLDHIHVADPVKQVIDRLTKRVEELEAQLEKTKKYSKTNKV